MKKEANIRQSFFSRQRGDKADFVRFALKEGTIVRAEQGGRGYYLLKEEIPLALAKKAFGRLLHRPLTEDEKARILGDE